MIGSKAEMLFKQSSVYAKRAQLSNRSKNIDYSETITIGKKQSQKEFDNATSSPDLLKSSLEECESSPDNIVKRVIRNTRKSQERIKKAICKKLAQSIHMQT